ncbi:hypothetical protein CPB86DRAFT_193350 [Serendipita vermifera]|nr:hypothetical protein CPB86DRAFT_193350 [Serendipita vermifera]
MRRGISCRMFLLPVFSLIPLFFVLVIRLQMLRTILLLLTPFSASLAAAAPTVTPIRPAALLSGDNIRIVATGGAVNPTSLSTGVNLLRTRYNLTVQQDPHVLDVYMYYAGTDSVRTQGVIDAFDEMNTFKVVWAARAHTLAQLESTLLTPSVLTNSPKWLIGYSDVTALHALWNKAGLAMFAVLSGTQAVTQTFAGAIRYTAPGGGGATGRLLGGNLSMLASLVGSGFLPSYQGAILLVEDTGEAAYSVDRLLTTLLRAADFDGIVGIAIGQLIGADTSSYTALQLLDLTLAPLGIPVITNLAIGHDTTQAMPVVLGAMAEIDVQTSQLNVNVPAV